MALTPIQKQLGKPMTRKQFLGFVLVAFASVFGVSALLRQLLSANTATTASIEAEAGTQSGNVTTVTDATASAGKSIKFGAASNPRDALVIGSYKPSASTTGVLAGTVLTDYNLPSVDTLTITTNNTIIENYRVYGDIKIQATGVRIRNCLLVGGNHTPATQSGIVDCNAANCFDALIEDCDIVPRKIALNRDGIVGHEYTARRCHIRNTIDGLGAFNKPDGSSEANVTIAGCYVHDLAYFYPDYRNGVSGATLHTDGSHNDGLQIQGGANIHVIGNNFMATAIAGPGTQANPAKPWLVGQGMANGSALLIQKQSTTAALVNVVAEKNWLMGGLAEASLMAGSYTFRNNICNRSVATGTGHSGYWLRAESRATAIVTGIETNRWEDTGAPLTEPRASGIHYNA
ncbi:MAG: hypothetical protein WBP26_04995 [Candidatus Saccharimonadales bacterium]